MNRRSAGKSITGSTSPRRLLFTAFMLLAFALQSYAVQTHIHEQLNLPAKASIAKLGIADSAPAKKPNAPGRDTTDDCPLCQLLYGGQYVAPNALVFFLPLVAVRALETELGAPPRYDAVSHSWRGRAPPRL